MLKVWEAVGELNERSSLGRVVINPPGNKSSIQPRELKDEWFLCSCGRGYSNLNSYQQHRIDHENNIDFKPTWATGSIKASNHTNRGNAQQQQRKQNGKQGVRSSSKLTAQQKLKMTKKKLLAKTRITGPHIPCQICHQLFFAPGRLRQHMAAKHPNDIQNLPPDNFEVPKIKKKTTIVNTSNTSIRCSKCSMTFKSTGGYYNHLTRVHGEKGKYKCSTCPNWSSFNFLTLQKHLRIHKVKQAQRKLKSVKVSTRIIKKDPECINEATKSIKVNKRSQVSKSSEDSSTGKCLDDKKKKGPTDPKSNMVSTRSGDRIKLPLHENQKKSRKSVFPCPQCNKIKYFYSEQSLRTHLELKHADEIKTTIKSSIQLSSETVLNRGLSNGNISSKLSHEERNKQNSRIQSKVVGLKNSRISRRSSVISQASSENKSSLNNDDERSSSRPPILKPIHKIPKNPQKDSVVDEHESNTTVNTFFYDAVGTRTRSKNSDETPPPTIDLMENKLESSSSIKLKGVSISPSKQSSQAPLQCTLCAHTFTTELALKSHLKQHNIARVYNKMKNSSMRTSSSLVQTARNNKSSVRTSLRQARRTKSLILNPTRKTKENQAASPTLNGTQNGLSKSHSPTDSKESVSALKSKSSDSCSSSNAESGFPCKLCPKVCTQSQALKKHMQSHTQAFKCHGCELSFTFKHNLEKHHKTAHPRSKINECPKCPDTFFDDEAWEAHKGYHKKENNKATQKTKQVSDDSLAANSLSESEQVSKAGQRGRRSKKLLAEVQTSSLKSTSPSTSKNDQKEQDHVNGSADKSKNYITCTLCNAQVAKKLEDYHNKVAHSGNGTFPCDQCNCSFMFLRGLRNHKRLAHKQEEETPAPCIRIEKKRNGRLKSNLITRINPVNKISKQHSSPSIIQETIKCDLCKFDIPGGKDAVLLHKQVAHVKSGEFKCSQCSCRYRTKKGLDSHIRHKIHTAENIKTASSSSSSSAQNNALDSKSPIQVGNKKSNSNGDEKRKSSIPPPSDQVKSRPKENSDRSKPSTNSPSSSTDKIRQDSSLEFKNEGVKVEKDSATVPKIICYYSQNPDFLEKQKSPPKKVNNNNNSVFNNNNNFRPKLQEDKDLSATKNNGKFSKNTNFNQIAASHYGIKDKTVTIFPVNSSNVSKTPPKSEKISTSSVKSKMGGLLPFTNFFRGIAHMSQTSNKGKSIGPEKKLGGHNISAYFSPINKSIPIILQRKQQTTSSSGNRTNTILITTSDPVSKPVNPNQLTVFTCALCDKTFFSQKLLSLHLETHMTDDEKTVCGPKQEKCGYCGKEILGTELLSHLTKCRVFSSTPPKNTS